jgi:hypothetical protein
MPARIRQFLTIPRNVKLCIIRENPLKPLFSPQSGGEKRGYPSPESVGGKRAFNIDNSANPLKSKQLALYQSFSVLI